MIRRARRPGGSPGGRDVAEAASLANTLVIQGVSAEEIVERLRQFPGGTDAVKQAARLLEGQAGFPAERSRELLLAAAEAGPIPAVLPELNASEEEQRQLLAMDLSAAFALLAARAPELLDLERRAIEGVPSSEWSRLARLAARAGDPQSRALASMHVLLRESTRLVGPQSGQREGLLASPAAEAVVRRHLARVAGALPSE